MVSASYLEATLKGFEAGLTVGSITSYPIITCDVDEEPQDVLARDDWSDFDVIPMRQDGSIVAVIERRNRVKRPLESRILVSANQPLEAFLATQGLIDDGYRLVIFGAEIEGIVTPSDLLRLPVRVFAFALLSHLEQVMNRVINDRHSCSDQWLAYLSDDRRGEFQQRQQQMHAERLNPDALEFVYLSDKAEILRKSGVISRAESKKLGGLVELRNQITHNRDYAHDHAELRDFMRRLQSIPEFISRLEDTASDEAPA